MRKKHRYLVSVTLLAGTMLLLQPLPSYGSLGSSPATAKLQQQDLITVTGTITDDQGNPVMGATVREEGGSAAAVSDMDGKFTLQVKPTATLSVSYIGFDTKRVSVSGKTSLTIVLSEDRQSLGEVVVVGYGTQKKVDLTGSVAAISEKDLD